MTKTKQKVERHYLKNVYGWVLVYTLEGENATITKTFKGNPVGEMMMSRDQARAHYACQVRAGFYRTKDGF